MNSQQFNLAAPPGFRGLHPDLQIRTYRRRLPHWRQHGVTYFITFRLADSIPQPQQQALKRWRKIWESSHPKPWTESDWREFAREITNRTEAWLDEGYGDCTLRQPAIAQLMQESMWKFQGDRYFVSCFVIMPNHVHAVLRPLGDHELEVILRNMKGYVARKANEALGRSGTFWEEETYDRIIRDEEHLYRIVQYIGRNPAKAGLPKTAWYRWIHPAWQEAGWNFEVA